MNDLPHSEIIERIGVRVVLLILLMLLLVVFGEIAQLSEWPDATVANMQAIVALTSYIVLFLIAAPLVRLLADGLELLGYNPKPAYCALYFIIACTIVWRALRDPSGPAVNTTVLGLVIALIPVLKGVEPYIQDVVANWVESGDLA